MTRDESRPSLRMMALAATAIAVVTLAGGIARADTTLTIESWRNDDSDIWNKQILPAFMAKHPTSRSCSRAIRRPSTTPP